MDTMRLIHWTGTPNGVCERRDNGTDTSEVRLPSGTTLTYLGTAYHLENVTCIRCLLAAGYDLLEGSSLLAARMAA